MNIITTDTNRIYTLELKNRKPGSRRWSPDCLDNLASTWEEFHEFDFDENAFMAPQEDVDAEIAWWESEVRDANADPDYEGDGICASGLEWELFVDYSDMAPYSASFTDARFVVKDEYLDEWFGDADPDEIEETQTQGLSISDIEHLAREWSCSMAELMEQVEEL